MYVDALDYAKDVAHRLSAISTKDYFMRSDKSIKDLIDEEWPLATLGKILYHPNRIIGIEYYGHYSQFGYDAKIAVSGIQKTIEGWDDETPIELTTVYYENAYLVREELAKYGFSHGSVEINRDENKGVVSKPYLRNFGEENKIFIPKIISGLNKKYAKKYPENCIIVCALYSEKEPLIQEWMDIVKAIYQQIGENIKYKTYLIDPFSCRYFLIRKTFSA